MDEGRVTTERVRAGFTFIELTISLSVLALLMAAVGMFQMRSQKATRAIQTQSDLERRANRALLAVTRELTGLGVHTLLPDPTTSLGTDILAFQKPASISGAGELIWSAPITFALLMDEGEAANGLDDDGDGLIDERQLSITRNGAVQPAVICHGVAAWLEGEVSNGLDDNGNGVVDERGFNVKRTGDLLDVRLTLQAPSGEGGVVSWTSTTALVIHN